MDNSYCFDENLLASTMSFDKDNILRIIVGFGGRACLEKALDNSQPTLKVIVWEPDRDCYEFYCKNNDITDLLNDERLIIVIGNDMEQLETVLKDNILDYNVHHFKVVPLGRYTIDGNPVMIKLVESLRNIIQPVANYEGTRKRFHKLPCKNFIYTVNSLNSNYVINQLLENITTRDIPVIIVSAGPSLMKNYRELKRAKGKALIIAVTHAMKTLNKDNIVPDIVAVTDPGKTNYMDFDNDGKYTLLSAVYADENCRKGYDGRIIFYGFNMFDDVFVVERTLKEQDVELDTGSVATDVFSIFTNAGFYKIILVGQDLAFDDKGNSHTDGERDIYSDDLDKDCIETDGIFGGKVRTRGDWERFRRFFEKNTKERPDIQVIDATEGGALIKGTKVMSMKEAVDTYCDKEYPVDEWINGLVMGDEKEKTIIDTWFDESIYNLRRMSRVLNEIVMLNESIRGAWQDTSLWNDEFKASCKRYDILYDQIINGTTGELLRFYCTEPMQIYIENALTVEGDENTEKRLQMEYELFSIMKEKDNEFIDYIVSLRENKNG